MEAAEHFLGDGIEGGEDILPAGGDGFKCGEPDASCSTIVEVALELGGRSGAGRVAFIILERDREARRIGPVVPDVLDHCMKRMVIRFEAVRRRIGDENEAIGAMENELAGRIIVDLAGHGVELEACLVAVDFCRMHREEIEEERAVRRGGERYEVTTLLLIHFGVDVSEIGRLATEGGATVDNLERDLFGLVVDECHRSFGGRASLN